MAAFISCKKKKLSSLLEGKRRGRLILETLCDVLARKLIRVRGCRNIVGNYATCGGSLLKAGDQHPSARDGLSL